MIVNSQRWIENVETGHRRWFKSKMEEFVACPRDDCKMMRELLRKMEAYAETYRLSAAVLEKLAELRCILYPS
jgi:hypothetical protein